MPDQFLKSTAVSAVSISQSSSSTTSLLLVLQRAVAAGLSTLVTSLCSPQQENTYLN